MNKEEIALRKLALLVEATNQLREQDDALEEVKTAAFEALLLNPGSDYKRWRTILVEQYSTELIDAFAPHLDPEDVLDAIPKLWQSDYTDLASGLTYDYDDWSKAFATKQSVQMYYDMIERLKNVDAK